MPRKSPNEQKLIAFFDSWSRSNAELCAGFEEIFHPECFWDQSPLTVTTGIPEALRFLQRSRRYFGLETADVEVVRIAASGNVVLVERIDTLRRRDGKAITTIPVAAAMEFKDGKLIYWREYYDVTLFVKDTLVKRLQRLIGRGD